LHLKCDFAPWRVVCKGLGGGWLILIAGQRLLGECDNELALCEVERYVPEKNNEAPPSRANTRASPSVARKEKQETNRRTRLHKQNLNQTSF
jgi:hypothetical protein